MDEKMLARIQADPNYQKLVGERSAFGWTLAIVMLVLYYGYIAVVAFDPAVIAQKVSGSITIGILLGAGLIVISVAADGGLHPAREFPLRCFDPRRRRRCDRSRPMIRKLTLSAGLALAAAPALAAGPIEAGTKQQTPTGRPSSSSRPSSP